MELDPDCTLGYTIGHEAWYWMPDRRAQRYVRVGADSSGGGCKWEFLVEEVVLSSQPGARAALQVCVFDDAWEAFAQVPELFAALAAEPPEDFAELCALLDRIGAKDTTARTRKDD
jgi:hypothetical protein